MALTGPERESHPPNHPDEAKSNQLRRRIAQVEPRCQRTYSSSLAVLERSFGWSHVTPEGRILADFTSGVLVANLGHNPRRWWKRVAELMGWDRLDDGADFGQSAALTAYNAVTSVEVEAAERLLANMQSQPGGGRMEQVLWSASGSEAIQKALWAAMARHDGADVVLATRGGFHGKKGLAGAVSGQEDDPDRDPRVRFISFPRDDCGSVVRRREPIDLVPYERELQTLADELGSRVAALVTEPYLGGGGSYHPQKEYLQLLERFCREQDAVFILDEIQSNFGRTGSMYAFTSYGVEPDMVVLGKGMANGIPIDAVVGRAELFATLDYGEGSDTWSGHPLGCAGVLATLDEFEQHDVLANAARLADVLEASLLRLERLDAVAAVRGEGTVWGIECNAFEDRSSGEVANEVVRLSYQGDESGRALHLLGPLAGNVLRIAPPLVMPPDVAQSYLDAMYAIVEKRFG